MLLCGGIGLAAMLIAGGGTWLAHSGWIGRQWTALTEAAGTRAADAGFVVRRVLAEGRRETTSSEVLRALDVRIGQPILDLDLAAARARLEQLPWVESATVERQLPDTLNVRLTEAEPLVLWQKQQKLHLVGRSGKVIDGATVERFADLLVVVGPDAPEHAADLLDMLASQPDLRRHVTAAVRIGGRRWNLRLDNAVDVKLPEDGSDAAWLELARLEREFGLLGRDLTVIDLREPDRLVVRLAPTAIDRDKPAGDDA
ncbi:MAG: cell division protein FtsQ/DivIB, partial [Dongiaceae bacterium]